MRVSVSPKTADKKAGSPPQAASVVKRPTISPPSGNYITEVEVSMQCSTPGAEIRYTLDGSTPTEASTLYAGPITLDVTPGAGTGADEYPVPLMDSTVGLYGGSNEPLGFHLDAGLAAQASLSATPVFVSLGMSTTANIFNEWDTNYPVATCDRINVAASGQTAGDWDGPNASGWDNLDEVINAGYALTDVEVCWQMLVEGTAPNPTVVSVAQLEAILVQIKSKYPNLKQLFVSTYMYGGYHSILGPPVDVGLWQCGVYVREFIQNHLGETNPWIGWGPYLWAYGLVPRSDALIWEAQDYNADGMHPSAAFGLPKAAALMEDFFTTSPVTEWYNA